MSKRAAPDPIDDNRNPLTAGQAAELADSLAGAECESAAQMLLLCFALAYEPDAGRRDEMFAAVAARVAPLTEGFTEMLKAAMRGQLKALRGARNEP